MDTFEFNMYWSSRTWYGHPLSMGKLFTRSPKLLRGFSYFIIMNMAVLCGTFDFMIGRHHGVEAYTKNAQ